MPDSASSQIENNASNAGKSEYRAEYTLPKNLVSRDWDLDDKDLTFQIREVTPNIQAQAMKNSSGDPVELQLAMTLLTIAAIGGESTKGKHDFRQRWWRSIGPQGRMLVMQAFMELQSVEEDDTAAFLGSRKDTST